MYERQLQVTITVTLTPPTSGTVFVNVKTGDTADTAMPGSDYVPIPEDTLTLVFPPGVTSRTFDVLLINDDLDTSEESFTVILYGQSSNAGLGANKKAEVKIKPSADNRANQKQVDLEIYDGQNVPELVPDAFEDDKIGAVTVANLNDTDGNARADKDDTFVRRAEATLTAAVKKGDTVITVANVKYFTAGDQVAISRSDDKAGELIGKISSIDSMAKTLTLAAGISNAYAVGAKVYHPGRDEVDLMKIVLKKPDPDNGGEVELKIVGGQVRIWENSWKETEVAMPKKLTTKDLPKTLWVEATGPSKSVRDIELRLEYGGKWDTVKATAVWANMSVRPAAEGVNPWVTRQAKDGFPNNPVPGKDLRDFSNIELALRINTLWIAADGSRYGHGTQWRDAVDKTKDTRIGGRILMEFELLPPGVEKDKLNVVFDITRQREVRDYFVLSGSGKVTPNITNDFPWRQSPPKDNENPNDDGSDIDESNTPRNGHIYSFDNPSVITQAFGAFEITRMSFKEWVRVRVDGNAFMHTNGLTEGSRASAQFDWHSVRYLKMNANGTVDPDNDALTFSVPERKATCKGNGTIQVKPNAKAGTEGFTVSFDKDKGWTLSSTSGAKTTVGGASPWTLTLADKVEVVITQGTIPFVMGDFAAFSAFKTSDPAGKKNETGPGPLTVTDGP